MLPLDGQAMVRKVVETVCNSTVARYGHVAGHAAAISWKLGRKMKFAPVTEHFPMDKVNDAMEHLRAGKARYRIVLDN